MYVSDNLRGRETETSHLREPLHLPFALADSPTAVLASRNATSSPLLLYDIEFKLPLEHTHHRHSNSPDIPFQQAYAISISMSNLSSSHGTTQRAPRILPILIPKQPWQNVYEVPAEIRVMIYHYFFQACTPIPDVPVDLDENHREALGPDARQPPFVTASKLQPTLALLQVSRDIRDEARPIFFKSYFSHARYVLQTRHSIYAFSRLPSPWTHALNEVSLVGFSKTTNRSNFNALKVAFVKAARFDPDAIITEIGLGHYRPEYNGITAPRVLRSHAHIADAVHGPAMEAEEERAMRASIKLKDSIVKFSAFGWRDGKIELKLTGRLGKLDWTMIPLMRHTQEAWVQQNKLWHGGILCHLHGDAEVERRLTPDEKQREVSEFIVEMSRELREETNPSPSAPLLGVLVSCLNREPRLD